MAFNPSTLPAAVRSAFQYGPIAWPLVVQEGIKAGITDVNKLTDIVFYLHHPERNGKPIQSGEQTLIDQWKSFRILVKPAVEHAPPRSTPAKKIERDEPVDLFALQYKRNSDGTYAWPWARSRTWGEGERWVEITTVGDLVRLVKNRCGSDGYVRSLRLGGHGDSTSFRMGDTSVSHLNIATIATQLQQILPYFRPGRSLVRLDHCNVGQNQALLKKVAKAFGGVAVIAPHDNQETNEGEPAFEGLATICGPNACVRVATPNMRTSSLLEIIHMYVDPVYENAWE
jgi:hypothetical protein